MLSAQLTDVYVGMTFESLCDASVDEFSSRDPPDLLAPRFRLACDSGLFQGNLVSLGHLRSLGGHRHECRTANKGRGDNAGK